MVKEALAIKCSLCPSRIMLSLQVCTYEIHISIMHVYFHSNMVRVGLICSVVLFIIDLHNIDIYIGLYLYQMMPSTFVRFLTTKVLYEYTLLHGVRDLPLSYLLAIHHSSIYKPSLDITAQIGYPYPHSIG